ncbi:MAG: arginine--tRNA ligase [Candidatus Paceibacterota bacterium]
MQETINTAIKDALAEMGLQPVDFVVEHPTDVSHGDYATNVALVAAKQADTNPREFAGTLKEKLAGVIEHIADITIAGPGFINFHLDRRYFTGVTDRILQDAQSWGRNDTWKSKLVLVEYTDPNPFKEFHIGHLFTNSVGESIARLFTMAGADVKRVNYQGDIGMHVAHAVWGMQNMNITTDSVFTARELGAAYARGATAYKEQPEVAEEMKRINRALYERSDPALNALYDKGRAASLAYFEEIYKLLDTTFERYFFESEAAPKGKALVLAHPDVFTKSDGAYVFDGEKEGLHTRVFLNSEGLPTYEAKELALANMKAEVYPYDHSVISTANEITEYFKVLLCAMSKVYPELAAKTEHIGHGTVRLSEGKMSSRTGSVIPAVDFIDEITEAAQKKAAEAGARGVDVDTARDVAIGAIKYATLKSNVLQDTIFNKDQALSFEGDSGPYLQYTHARICSVLEKAATAGVVPSVSVAPEAPYAIERIIYQFPEVVERSLTERSPHHVAGYLTELASAFNTFYAHERIADATDEYAPYKAAVADAVRQTLANGLWVLGIKAPERM